MVKKEEKAEKVEKASKEEKSHRAEKAVSEGKQKAEGKKPGKEEKAKPKAEKEEKKVVKEKPEKEKKTAKEEAVKKEEKVEPVEEKKHVHREGHKQPKEEKEFKGRQKPKRGKPSKEKFVELKPKELEEAVVHLANEGHSQSEIGMMLRDQYGVPRVSVVSGKKLGQILAKHNLLGQVPEDLMNLIRKSVRLREHLNRNKKDMSAKRGLMLTVSKIRSLEKYYKKQGKLPLSWRYSPETAALLAK